MGRTRTRVSLNYEDMTVMAEIGRKVSEPDRQIHSLDLDPVTTQTTGDKHAGKTTNLTGRPCRS
uniref:Uncharacterized protein n=1 Tax=Candidatus Kentrum sp. MB TaxID=2138164 RepID=A0A450XST3_9GAMM|nr:MAG: hypothetical protein BECKMB1821G_GA0114241_103417 [Candidatus Kentron sp. MB]VFK32351.1 MAG: hypothetical protein BECKMB1821I_GA0114274_103217 [Candidatus Kentron sp. MB]VFK75843.1 MAG: hypothetical protein BECKMB1821H_GA0114242_103317 [Candidatus Kentron sp. MB]